MRRVDRFFTVVAGLIASSIGAATPGLSFDQVFAAKGEPASLHVNVLFVGEGGVHRMELWRDHDRHVKRVTDRSIESFATHRSGDTGYGLTILDRKRRISTTIERTNLYRVGSFTDWFDLTHGLRHPKGVYRLVAASAPKGMPSITSACTWYDLTQGVRTTHICWDEKHRIPMLIASADARPIWRIVAIDTVAVPNATFVPDDRGFIKNDANRDIDRD